MTTSGWQFLGNGLLEVEPAVKVRQAVVAAEVIVKQQRSVLRARLIVLRLAPGQCGAEGQPLGEAASELYLQGLVVGGEAEKVLGYRGSLAEGYVERIVGCRSGHRCWVG